MIAFAICASISAVTVVLSSTVWNPGASIFMYYFSPYFWGVLFWLGYTINEVAVSTEPLGVSRGDCLWAALVPIWGYFLFQVEVPFQAGFPAVLSALTILVWMTCRYLIGFDSPRGRILSAVLGLVLGVFFFQTVLDQPTLRDAIFLVAPGVFWRLLLPLGWTWPFHVSFHFASGMGWYAPVPKASADDAIGPAAELDNAARAVPRVRKLRIVVLLLFGLAIALAGGIPHLLIR